MRVILIGHGSNAGYWLDDLSSHRQSILVAIVNDEADASSGAGVPPVFSTLDTALHKVQANAVFLSGDTFIENADRALSAGLSLIVANPESVTMDEVQALTAAANRGSGRIFAIRTLQYRKCGRMVRRFLQSERLGAIGLVSCIDRRSRSANAKHAVGEGSQLGRFGASQLLEICDLFDSPPLNVMARVTGMAGAGSYTEAYLELRDRTHIHYFGSLDAGIDEHTLWIEGTKGSLRTNGRSVWWRKRGWPVFVPVRPGLPQSDSADSTGFGRVAALIDRRSADAGPDDLPLIELTAVAMESGRRQRPMKLSQDMAGAAKP